MKPIYAKPPLGNRTAFQVRKDYFDLLDTKWHYHAEYELTYIHYPQGKRVAGNSIHSFEADDLVFYGPNLPHAWSHEAGEQTISNGGLAYYAIVVHFTPDCFGDTFFSIPEMNTVQTVLQKSKRGIVLLGESRRRVSDWMHQLVDASGAKRVVLLLNILEEAAACSTHDLLSVAGYWDNLNDNDAVRMSSIYEYLIANFTEDIALEEIAELAHISPSAFCRYFKARTKKTLKEFINDLRINLACELLEENKLSITQICFEAGFNNISNFNRRFKEIKGITPQQYKSNILGVYNNTNKALKLSSSG